MKAWTQVGKFEDTPNQGSRIAATASGDMALFRTEDDRVFAVPDRCPHKEGFPRVSSAAIGSPAIGITGSLNERVPGPWPRMRGIPLVLP